MFTKKQNFKYKMRLVELTKLLERETVDTLTFTYKLGHNHTSGATFAEYVQSTDAWAGYWNSDDANNYYLSPVSKNNSIKIKNIQFYEDRFPPLVAVETKIYIVTPSGTEVYLGITNGDTGTNWGNYTPTDDGSYTLSYRAKAFDSSSIRVEYTFESVTVSTPKPVPSITECVERILDVTPLRKVGEPRKYKLDPVFAAKYANVPAPEFYITRNTLREALAIIGGYIHAIPRLNWDIETDSATLITFDELGGSDEYVLPSYAKMIGYNRGINPHEYCGALESYVDNLIDTKNQAEGSITEPSAGAMKTTRSQSIQISNDTAIIETERPIYRIIKLECAYVDSQTIVGDITPFVFEKSEYETLTSHGGRYPYSKKYALCYQQGDNKITGLSVTETVPSTGAILFTQESMANIINSVLGKSSSTGYDFANLAFRVTYIPVVSTRLKQLYPYTTRPHDNTLFYNQGSNTVEASYYGENMKGRIARQGQYNTDYTYRFYSMNDVPKAGQKFKGEYISRVQQEIDITSIKCTFTTTPNFNKLSQYLALNSSYRLFDVSEKQSVARDINYSEICYVGDKDNDKSIDSIDSSTVQKWSKVFTQAPNSGPITVAVSKGKTKEQQDIGATTAHAVSSVAFGNSLVFQWEYMDNYSAGNEATYYSNKIKLAKKVPYGDVYGELYAINYSLATGLYQDNTYSEQLSTSSNQGTCDMLPKVQDYGSIREANLFYNLIVRKDNREQLRICNQLHFVANRESIVLGSRLFHNNPLITTVDISKSAKVVFLPYELNGLSDIIDVSNAHTYLSNVSSSMTFDYKKCKIESMYNNTTKQYKSWALIDPTDNRLYIGENVDLKVGWSSSPIYFNF